MARGKEAAADEPKKRKRKGAESSDEEAQAAEDDKENQQLNGVEAEEMKEEEKGGEQEEEEEEDEEDAAASKGKRKKASSSSDSPSSKKGSGGGDAHSVVLAYMQRTNRPYSAINVADNLQGALSKTQTVKVLDELTESGTTAHSSRAPRRAGRTCAHISALCCAVLCWAVLSCRQADCERVRQEQGVLCSAEGQGRYARGHGQYRPADSGSGNSVAHNPHSTAPLASHKRPIAHCIAPLRACLLASRAVD